MKCYNLYNSSNVVTYDMTGYTDAKHESLEPSAYCLSRNTRQVYDILSTRNALRSIFGDSMNNPASLNNFVGLFLDSGNHGGTLTGEKTH